MGIIPKELSGVICNVFTKIGANLDPSRAVSIEVLVFSIFASIPSTEMTSPAETKDEPGNSGISWNDSGNVDPQLSLFPEESLYLDELRKLNLNDMTPLQALNYLHELTDRLRH